MKKKHSGTSRGTKSSRIALMAGMLAAPMVGLPAPAMAQTQTAKQQPALQAPAFDVYIKLSAVQLKSVGTLNVLGVKGSQPVFQNGKGELFTFSPSNGDMQFLPKNEMFTKWIDVQSFQWGVVGMDRQGRMILKDDKGQQFFFDQSGKKNFVKVK
jgi:hypothetical protein